MKDRKIESLIKKLESKEKYMKYMKKLIYYLTQLILFVIFLLSCFAIANTMVNMKYEADDGCISGITGENLCLQKTMWIALCVLTVVLMIILGFYKKEMVRKD